MKKPARRFWILCLGVAISLSSLQFFGVAGLMAQEPASRSVGDLGDPQRLVFAGLHTFDTDIVRNGLLGNTDFVLASHPAAPLADYLTTLRDKVRDGYLAAGFPEVQVSASLDSPSERIFVKVNEGTRCRQAGIKITGAGNLPGELLKRRLTEIPPSADPARQSISERMQANGSNGDSDDDSPVWEPGKPAAFDDPHIKRITEDLDKALQELGCFFVKTEVKIVPNGRQGTADLVIKVLDEGSSGVINKIKIAGLQQNSRAELLDYLGLKPGMAVNRELLKHTEKALWNSARFLAFEVSPEVDPDRHRINLKIDLKEFEPMPPLNQHLSRAAEGLLHFREWLSDKPSPGHDLVFAFRPQEKRLASPKVSSIHLVLSDQGLIVTAEDGSLTENASALLAAVVSPDTVGLFDLAARNKLAFSMTNSTVRLDAWWKMLSDTNSAARPFALTFGAHFKTLGDQAGQAKPNSRAPFGVSCLLAPVAFAGLAYDKNELRQASFTNGLMTLTSEDFNLTIDEKSGKLIGLDGENAFHVSMEGHAFDNALAKISTGSATDRNYADSRQPIDSVLAFLSEEAVQTKLSKPLFATNLPDESRLRAAAALGKILDHGIFAPLDAMLIRRLPPAGTESFYVPIDPASASGSAGLVSAILSMVVFQYSGDLLPRGSWPFQVLRETTLCLGNNGKYTGAVLDSIYESNRTGPLAFATITALLDLCHSPAKAAFAGEGLKRMSETNFANDCAVLLDEDSVLQQCLANAARGLASLSDAEVADLAVLFPPDVAAGLRVAAQSSRQSSQPSLAFAMSPALKEVWDSRWK